MEKGVIVSYFLSQLTEADAKHLNIKIGEASAQQAAECMAVLVGLRAWQRYWLHRRCSFALKGDNTTAVEYGIDAERTSRRSENNCKRALFHLFLGRLRAKSGHAHSRRCECCER